MYREPQTALAAVALGAVEPTRVVMDAAQYCCASQLLLLLFWFWWMRDGAQEESVCPVIPWWTVLRPIQGAQGHVSDR
jgi:hypothetical protein